MTTQELLEKEIYLRGSIISIAIDVEDTLEIIITSLLFKDDNDYINFREFVSSHIYLHKKILIFKNVLNKKTKISNKFKEPLKTLDTLNNIRNLFAHETVDYTATSLKNQDNIFIKNYSNGNQIKNARTYEELNNTFIDIQNLLKTLKQISEEIENGTTFQAIPS